MGKIVLFSPVGGTDPISQSNYRDGSLLHISRVYKPDKIVLYMSKEVIDLQDADDRYRYCLNKLYGKLSKDVSIEEILRPDLIEVQDFNLFYSEFREILLQLYRELDREDTLIINVSSGTPAMKSALLVLVTLGELPCKAIQVTTPAKKMNEHVHKGYDVGLLWEMNEDNDEGYENRCDEIECAALLKINKEDIIKRFISIYDYFAALQVTKTMPFEYVAGYIDLIKMATDRLSLNYKEAYKKAKAYGADGFPVKNDDIVKYFEYVLSLDIKIKKGELADFIRAITPIIVVIFEHILIKQCGLDINKYLSVNKIGKEWDTDKLRGTKIERILADRYTHFNYGPVYSAHLSELIDRLSDSAEVKDIVNSLRSVESKVRNMAAHEVTMVTDKYIFEKTGMRSEEIVGLIKKSFVYTDMNIKSDYWRAYDDMNEYIMKRMS